MPRILVVDDVAADRAMVKALLGTVAANKIEFASNGREALEAIASDNPDLIVSDLQMPEVNGLELVRAVRQEHPSVPVVLMTAHGSEIIAVEALKAGAASYVPKSHLAKRLKITVAEILSTSRANRDHDQLMERLENAHFEFRLDNDPEMIPALVDYLQDLVGGALHCDRTTRTRVGVALEQALLNGLYHGNLEITGEDTEQAKKSLLEAKSLPLAEQRRRQSPYSKRSIHVQAVISKSQVHFVIRDEGPGFDHHRALSEAYEPPSMDRPRGRGLVLIQSFMDEVTYNETGNEVTLVKRREHVSALGLREGALRMFDVEQSGDTLIVIPRRNISSFVEGRVQRELGFILKSLSRSQIQNVVIDFDKLTYFGSSMLEAMRIVSQEVNRLKGSVAACNLSPVGREILSIAKYNETWPVEETRSEAVQLVSGEGD